MASRGSYAKGIAKREEILRAALEVIAREGMRGASVREIADAVGLSQAGLLHYFESKEALFAEILRTRDQIDLESFGEPSGEMTFDQQAAFYLRVIEHNAEVPGLVRLFAQLSVEAADPTHPAHEYFIERSALIQGGFRSAITTARERGELPDGIDADTAARMLQAIWDGAQVQWLLDPAVDMTLPVASFLESLR